VNLPDDLRTTLKRNTGALIKIVMNDSPAFRANVIPGDILIKIDETPIYSATELSSTLLSFAGKDCVLTILRDGKEIQISVKMNPLQ
jgi:S1-C subfamily serine protease